MPRQLNMGRKEENLPNTNKTYGTGRREEGEMGTRRRPNRERKGGIFLKEKPRKRMNDSPKNRIPESKARPRVE
jgi:hypothetical protein